jgi:hypothetical protein
VIIYAGISVLKSNLGRGQILSRLFLLWGHLVLVLPSHLYHRFPPPGDLTGFAHIVLVHQDVMQHTDRHYVTWGRRKVALAE